MNRVFLLLQLLIGMILQLYFNWLVPEAVILLWILLVHAVGGHSVSAVTLSALVGAVLDFVYGRTVPITAIALPLLCRWPSPPVTRLCRWPWALFGLPPSACPERWPD